MSISIIGTGNVGMALGHALTRRGETVVFGVQNPAAYAGELAKLGPLATVRTNAEAIAASEVVILAIPHAAVAAVAQSVGDWGGKILVDATNPLAPDLSGLTVGTTTSSAEELAKLAKGARVVKAFNTTGAENMADTSYAGGTPFMPVCGDDAGARSKVIALAASIGFDAVDCGDLTVARFLEPFAMTWIHMAIKLGMGRRFAFARLQR